MSYSADKTIDGLDALTTLDDTDVLVAGDQSDSDRAKKITKANLQADLTVTASQVSDFDTEVGNNSAVTANTDKISFDSTSSTRLANTSGTNTGDQSLTTYQLKPAEGAFVDGDKTKLDGIETSADVNNISDVNATDLTDAGDSILHYHATDRARANHTGTQASATISDFDTEVGNNSAVAANTAKVTNATHTGDVTGDEALTIGAGKVTEAMQVLADNTTNNVSSTKHGYAPKGDGTTTKYLNADGAYSTPATGGTPEGTAILSTGETVGKVLQADGDDSSSWVTLPGGGDALVANPLSQFAATTSAQLAGVLSDETGTGLAVFNTSPTLVTPALGTPSALVGTNISGTASGLTAGTVSTIAGLAPDTATTQATQAGITTCANLTTVGTIGTGVWQGTAINQTYLTGQSGTNTGDESDASATVKGIVELATSSETDTGTDTTRAVTPDALQGSKRNIRWLTFNLVEAGTDCAVATNIAGDFLSPIAGTILQSDSAPFYIYATNSTAGTTGTMVVDVSINGTSIMTTNKIDIDTTEKTSTTGATPPDLTTTALAVGNIITIDIDSVHTTAAKGLTVYIGVRE